MKPFSKWFGFSALLSSVALNLLDQTILPVSLPSIQKDLIATSTELQWTVNAYLLAISIFVLIGGKIGDRIGLRNAFSMGMAIFGLSSFFCVVSPNINWLIGARALQGFGAAIMFPTQIALLASLFPVHQRGRATGLIASVGSLFLVLGPAIGGFLSQHLSWHWIFLINLPISVFGIVIGKLFLPDTKPTYTRMDFIGFALFLCSAFPLVTFFMQVNDWGWFSHLSIFCVVAAVIFSTSLFIREKILPISFLELSLFKSPVYLSSCLTTSIIQFVLSITVFETIYFQTILNYSASQAGLIISFCGIPILFFGNIAGYLSDKISPKLPIALGHLILIFYFFWFFFFSTPSLIQLLIPLFFLGIGITFIFTPSISAAMSAIPEKKLGVGFGLQLTCRMIAGSVGIAIVHLFVTFIQQLESPSIGMQQATILSFSRIHLIFGFFIIATFAITFILYKRKSAHRCPDFPADGWD